MTVWVWVCSQRPKQRWLFFSRLCFLNRSKKNTSLDEFTCCEISNRKEPFPFLVLARILFLCLIRTRIIWLLLRAAVEHGTLIFDLNLLPFTGRIKTKSRSPFHLLAQNKGSPTVPRRINTGKDLA